MTAEIAMLNSQAVAMAADSAVSIKTAEGYKVLPSANKIFTLSKYHPVGVMVYGNANLLRAPWELIIKSYREQLGRRNFASLEDFAVDLLDFIAGSRALFPESVQDQYVLGGARDVVQGFLNQTMEMVGGAIDQDGSVDQAAIEGISGEVIDAAYELWDTLTLPPTVPEDLCEKVRERYEEAIGEIIVQVYEELPLSEEHRNKLIDLAVFYVTKMTPQPNEGESGLVVAGYGADEYWPVLRSYRIEGLVNNTLIFAEDRHHDVGRGGSGIIPFAQSEMVHAFIEGVEPNYQARLEDELRRSLRQFADVAAEGSGLEDSDRETFQAALQKMASDASDEFSNSALQFRRQFFISPTLDVAAILPKDELAAMAESLVNLTAFRRRMSMDAETVGGPIDVAVISKGDGFIWIKRKHYFRPELNPHFVRNYFHVEGEISHGKEVGSEIE